jgi:prepilin signal peptidase PulO-like enzyme (type II secretory pathway)
MMAVQKGDMKYALPFGTFLAIGTVIAMFVGDPLVAWYAGFL